MATPAADAGYELLLANSLETVRRECFAAPGLTHSGVWLIPAVGRFDMGGRDFTCALDAFGKWSVAPRAGAHDRTRFVPDFDVSGC